MSHPDGTMDSIVAEMPAVDDYKHLARVMLQKKRPDEYALLVQKNNHGGEKRVFGLQEVGRELNISLLGHKIILLPDGVSYSHLLIFGPLSSSSCSSSSCSSSSCSSSSCSSSSIKDVIPAGPHFHQDSFSINAACYMMQFLRQMHIYRITIVPFACGTIPFIAQTLFDIDTNQPTSAQSSFAFDETTAHEKIFSAEFFTGKRQKRN